MRQPEPHSPGTNPPSQTLAAKLSFRRLEVRGGKTVAVFHHFHRKDQTPELRIRSSPDPWSKDFDHVGEIALSEADLEHRLTLIRQQGLLDSDEGATQEAIDQIKILKGSQVLDRKYNFTFHREQKGAEKTLRIGLLDMTPTVCVSAGELDLVDEFDPSSGMNCLRIKSLQVLADTGLNPEPPPLPQWNPESVAALLLKEAQKIYPNSPIRNNDGMAFAYSGTDIELIDHRRGRDHGAETSVVHRRIYHYNLHPQVQFIFTPAHNEYQILQAIESIEAHDDGDNSRRPWETARNMIDAAKIFADQCCRGRQQHLHRKQPVNSRDAINSLTQSRQTPLIDIGNSAGDKESLRTLASDCLSGIGAMSPIKNPALLSKLATQTANRNGIQLTHRLRREFEAAYLGALQDYKAGLISSDIIKGVPGSATAEEIEAAIQFHAERRGWEDLRSEQGQARRQKVLDEIAWPTSSSPPKDWYLRADLIGITQADSARITEIFRAAQAKKETGEDQDETEARERPK